MVYRLMKNNRVFFRHFFWLIQWIWLKQFKSTMNTNCPHCFFDQNTNVDCILNFINFFFQTNRKKSSRSVFSITFKILLENKRESKQRKYFDVQIFFLLLVFLMRIVNRNFTLKMSFFFGIFLLTELPNCLMKEPMKTHQMNGSVCVWVTKKIERSYYSLLSLCIYLFGHLLVTMPKQVLTTDKSHLYDVSKQCVWEFMSDAYVYECLWVSVYDTTVYKALCSVCTYGHNIWFVYPRINSVYNFCLKKIRCMWIEPKIKWNKSFYSLWKWWLMSVILGSW